MHSTIAIKLTLCALLGLVAALVDLIAVVGRRGALAGVPLLVIFTISGAVPREPVSWYLFALAASAFLILLALDSSDDLQRWGHYVPRPNRLRSRIGRDRPARRRDRDRARGAPSRVRAVELRQPARRPVPRRRQQRSGHRARPRQRNRRRRHRPLRRPARPAQPQGADRPLRRHGDLAVRRAGRAVAASAAVLRAHERALATSARRAGGRAAPETSSRSTTPDTPPRPAPSSRPAPSQFGVRVSVTNLTSNPPVFAQPTAVEGLDSDARWSTQDLLLEDTRIHPGDSYQMSVQQTSPTTDALKAAVGVDPRPRPVADLQRHHRLRPHARAGAHRRAPRRRTTETMAIYDYFTDPANQFAYSLATADRELRRRPRPTSC